MEIPKLPDVLRTEDEIIATWKGDISKPLVSVRCITYNHAPYIEDAIKGFLIQETDFPIEVWIHDDASTDGTREIVESYQKRYPNIIKTILQDENQYSKGVKPRSFLEKRLKGKYVALCEGDDYWCLPEKLQAQADFLENNPDYACCFHGFSWISSGGDALKVECPDNGLVEFSRLDMMMLIGKKNSKRRTLTMMFLASHKQPPESQGVVNGDLFLYSTLGVLGKGMYLPGLNAACFREHEGGVWSSRNEAQRRVERVKTHLALAEFHKRMKNHEVAGYFEYKAAIQALNGSSKPLRSIYLLLKALARSAVIRVVKTWRNK